MSDARLRELERTWRATGADGDHAALLLERVRVGLLGEVRLQLAAELGHPAARIALPIPPPEPARRRPAHEVTWSQMLFGYGRTLGGDAEGRVFAARAWATQEDIARFRHTLRTNGPFQTWVDAGQEAMIRAGLAVFMRLPELAEGLRPGLSIADVHAVEANLLADRLPEPFSPDSAHDQRVLPLTGYGFLGHGFIGNTYPWERYVRTAEERVGVEEARRVIAAELIPWALDERDPLRERVEARRAGGAG